MHKWVIFLMKILVHDHNIFVDFRWWTLDLNEKWNNSLHYSSYSLYTDNGGRYWHVNDRVYNPMAWQNDRTGNTQWDEFKPKLIKYQNFVSFIIDVCFKLQNPTSLQR